jgi:hypothetical protein
MHAPLARGLTGIVTTPPTQRVRCTPSKPPSSTRDGTIARGPRSLSGTGKVSDAESSGARGHHHGRYSRSKRAGKLAIASIPRSRCDAVHTTFDPTESRTRYQ